MVPLALNLNQSNSVASQSFNLAKLNGASVALNTAVNVVITAMISIKILSVSRSLRNCVHSTTSHARTYTNIVTILVESAAPCAILGVLTCIGWFINVDTVSAFGLSNEAVELAWSMSIVSFIYLFQSYRKAIKILYLCFQALFPQLIIYRVAKGSAWTKETSRELTQALGSLDFAPRTIDKTTPGSAVNTLTEGVLPYVNEESLIRSVSS
jgi:hypothetical protein